MKEKFTETKKIQHKFADQKVLTFKYRSDTDLSHAAQFNYTG